jgi:hypothetical protein
MAPSLQEAGRLTLAEGRFASTRSPASMAMSGSTGWSRYRRLVDD